MNPRLIIILCILFFNSLIAQKEIKYTYKYKKLSNGLGVKYFNKNKKNPLPSNSQRVFINYSLFHQKDTSILKKIIISSEKNFIIGSEEILKGLEEALLVMHLGDSAVFKIPPHLAYGEKKTGNILPNSTLYFFVKLINIEDEFFNHLGKDTLIFQSGLKKIKVLEGIGKHVKNFERVEINYTGYVYSTKGYRQIFESTKLKKAGIIFQTGTGMLLPGLDEGVLSMNVGEKATLIIPPHLGYMDRQVGKILPNTTLYYDIEIIKSYSPFFEIDGKVQKTLMDGVKVIMLKDTSTVKSTIEDLVQFDYMAYYKDKNGNSFLFDNSFQNEKAMMVRPGSGLSLPGLDNALQQLGTNDYATVIVPYYQYKYQKTLNFVPDTLPIYYDIYVNYVSKYPFMEMNRTDTIKNISGLKFIDVVYGMGEDLVKNKSVAKVAYTVYYYDNSGIRHIVDGTRENGKRIDVEVGSGTSVRGLEEGLIGMKTNGSRRIIIPAELAYGKEGVPQRGIPPGVTLIFDVEHLEIIKK